MTYDVLLWVACLRPFDGVVHETAFDALQVGWCRAQPRPTKSEPISMLFHHRTHRRAISPHVVLGASVDARYYQITTCDDAPVVLVCGNLGKIGACRPADALDCRRGRLGGSVLKGLNLPLSTLVSHQQLSADVADFRRFGQSFVNLRTSA
jgi:hypothetical protein